MYQKNVTPPITQTLQFSNTYSIHLTLVSREEIYKIILRSLKNSTSHSYDESSSNLLKTCSVEITMPIAQLIHRSFEKCEFPNELKQPIGKPMYKNGSQRDLTDFGPISMLSALSKPFEKAMATRLISFM